MINCRQLSPRGLNRQVNQTDHLPGGICGTDDEAPIKPHLCFNPRSCWESLDEGFLRRCRQLTSTLPVLLSFASTWTRGAKSMRSERAVQPQCGGGATCAGRRMSRWSRLRGNAEEISPRFTMCFSPTEWCEIKHVKWNMWSGGMGFTSMQEASAPSRVEACTFVSVNPPTQEYTHAACPYGNLQLCRRAEEKPRATVNGSKVP